MYEMFHALATYNKAANEMVVAHLRAMGPEKALAEHPTYYPNILKTLLHVLRSDIRWTERLPFPGSGKLGKLDVDSLSVEDYLRYRTQVDDDIIQVIESRKDADFTAMTRIELGKKVFERPLWQFLLQWFNHHAHHRGQVSVLLDLEGVDNDYSGVLDKI
ncbi:MAG TPA: DinB family protein [Spirochaetia bacterium]|nr:DinB family protein [Spirochaetia bacterium]